MRTQLICACIFLTLSCATAELPSASVRLNAGGCCCTLDIQIGDSVEDVFSIIPITGDPNGPNQNPVWRSGSDTDFFSTSGPRHQFAAGGALNSSVFCTFDDQRRLKALSVVWTYDGEGTPQASVDITRWLLNEAHPCFTGRIVAGPGNDWVFQHVANGYVHELRSSTAGVFWRVEYSQARDAPVAPPPN